MDRKRKKRWIVRSKSYIPIKGSDILALLIDASLEMLEHVRMERHGLHLDPTRAFRYCPYSSCRVS
jgi:hypothetical protein